MSFFILNTLKKGLTKHLLYEKLHSHLFTNNLNKKWKLFDYVSEEKLNTDIRLFNRNVLEYIDSINYKKLKFIEYKWLNDYNHWYKCNYLFKFEQLLIGHNLTNHIKKEIKQKKYKLELITNLCNLFLKKIEINQMKYKVLLLENPFFLLTLLADHLCFLLEKFVFLKDIKKFNDYYEFNLKVLMLKSFRSWERRLLWGYLGIRTEGSLIFHYRRNVYIHNRDLFAKRNRDFIVYLPYNFLFDKWHYLVYCRLWQHKHKIWELKEIIMALNMKWQGYLVRKSFLINYKKYINYKRSSFLFYFNYRKKFDLKNLKTYFNLKNLKTHFNLKKIIFFMSQKENYVLKVKKPVKTRDRKFMKALSLKNENLIDSIFFIYFDNNLDKSFKIKNSALIKINKKFFKGKWTFNKLKYFKLLFSIFLDLIWSYKIAFKNENFFYAIYWLYLKNKVGFEKKINVEDIKNIYFAEGWSTIQVALFFKIFKLNNKKVFLLVLDFRHDVLYQTLFYWYNKYWKINMKQKKLLLLKKEKLFISLQKNLKFFECIKKNIFILKRLYIIYYLGYQRIWLLNEKTQIINLKLFLLKNIFLKYYKKNIFKKIIKKKYMYRTIILKKKYKLILFILFLLNFKYLKFYKNKKKFNKLRLRQILKNKNIKLFNNKATLKQIKKILNSYLYKLQLLKNKKINKLPSYITAKFSRSRSTVYYLFKNFRVYMKSLITPFIYKLALFFFNLKLKNMKILNYIFLKKKAKSFILKNLYFFIGLKKYKKIKKVKIDWSFGFNLKKKKYIKNKVDLCNLYNISELNRTSYLLSKAIKIKQNKYNYLNNIILLSEEKLNDIVYFFKYIYVSDLIYYYVLLFKTRENEKERVDDIIMLQTYRELKKIKYNKLISLRLYFIDYNSWWVRQKNDIYIKQNEINNKKRYYIDFFIDFIASKEVMPDLLETLTNHFGFFIDLELLVHLSRGSLYIHGGLLTFLRVLFFTYLDYKNTWLANSLIWVDEKILLFKRKLLNLNRSLKLNNKITKSFYYVAFYNKNLKKENKNYIYNIQFLNNFWKKNIKNFFYKVNCSFFYFFKFNCNQCNYIKISEDFYKSMLYYQNLIFNQLKIIKNIYKFNFIFCKKCGQLRISMFNDYLFYTNNWKEIILLFIKKKKKKMFLFYKYWIYFLIRLPDNTLIFQRVKILGFGLKFNAHNLFFPFFFFFFNENNNNYALLTKSSKWCKHVFIGIVSFIQKKYQERLDLYVAQDHFRRLKYKNRDIDDATGWDVYTKKEEVLFKKIKLEKKGQGYSTKRIKRLCYLYKKEKKKEVQDEKFRMLGKKEKWPDALYL